MVDAEPFLKLLGQVDSLAIGVPMMAWTCEAVAWRPFEREWPFLCWPVAGV